MPPHVYQRAARVTRVDGRVGLDEIFQLLEVRRRAPQRAHTASRHREVQSEGISESHDGVADAQIGGIPQRNGRQIARLDLHHREIRLRVTSHHFAFERALIPQHHLDIAGALNHVVVGHNVSVRIDDHPAAERVFILPAGNLGKHVTKELFEERVTEERRLLNFDHLCGADIDY